MLIERFNINTNAFQQMLKMAVPMKKLFLILLLFSVVRFADAQLIRLGPTGAQVTGVLGTTNGGTALSSYVLGDLLYASGTDVLAVLNAGTQYQVLQMGATVPTWGAVNLAQAAAVTGTLPFGNGGTGATSFTGDRCVRVNTGGTALEVAAADCAAATGTVTSIAATSPIVVTPDPITDTGDISCPTCLTGLDFTTIGGLVGTQLNAAVPGATATIGTPYAGSSTTAKWVPQSNYTLSGPWLCIAAAETPGSYGMVFWNTKDFASTTLVHDNQASVIPPSAAAGCYGNSLTRFSAMTYQLYSFTGTGNAFGTGIRGVGAYVLGSRVQPLSNYLGLSTVGSSTTNYSTVGQGNTAGVTNEDLVIVPVPFAGTLQNSAIITGGTQSALGSLVLTLRDDKADTAVVATVPASGLAGIRIDHTNTAAFAAHSGISVKIQNNAGATSTSIESFHFEIVPTSSTVKGLMAFPKYNQAIVASSSRYVGGFYNIGIQSSEASSWTPIPYPTASMQYLDCWVQTAPANDLTITVMLNGSGTALTGTVTSGFSVPGVFSIDAGSPVALTEGDRVSILFAAGSGTQAVISGCGLEIDD